MSDRSGKDAVTEHGRINAFLEKPLKELEGQDYFTNHTGLPAVYRAFSQALKVTSGADALSLLLVSFRTLADVKMRLHYADTWELIIAVREWCDMDPSLEFRGFIHKNSFTARSQYFYDCYFPVLKANEEKISSSIKAFWETIKDKVPYESYVMDFAILPCNISESEVLPVTIIELNPFDDSTDSALFSWKLDRGKLMKGPFSLRLTKESKEINTKHYGANWWKKLITNFLDSQSKDELRKLMLS